MLYKIIVSQLAYTFRCTQQRLFTCGLMLSLLASPIATIYAASGDYVAIPPFVAENTGKPNVIIALDISGSMKEVAYADVGAGNWKTGLHDDFNPTTSYFGYFDGTKKYTYNQGFGFFIEDGAGDWNGNFLNWLSMRRMDVVRKVLVGGKVRNRSGENHGGTTYYVLEGQNEPYDYSFRKSYTTGSSVSPYPDGQEFVIADGQIKPVTSANAASVAINNKLEVGRATMDWSVGDSWLDVEFANTYTDPIVVAHAVSYNGAAPVVARVKDVGASIGSNGGFRIRIQEWDYDDHKHTTEDIIYMVAERGTHNLSMDDGSTVVFQAGKITTNTVTGSTASFSSVLFPTAFTTTPVVFTGVSTYNESNPEAEVVTTRVTNINSFGFETALQEQEANPQSHVMEDIHYIAIETVTGTTASGGVPIEVGRTGNNVTDSWYTLNFSTSFSNVPMVALNMQSFSGMNTASVRYGNAVLTNSAIDIQIDEEKSSDTETTHASESVGYFAVPGSGINIQLGLTEVPTGIVQSNSGGMRFGLAVYNYDHRKSPSSIYNGNTVDGGTLFPCYPDISKPLSDRTNYDICLETHVKAPIDNIITVIEDHPLIWGTTPIAETLYEIYGYVAQKNNARNSHAYFYDNGTEADTSAYPSYKINNDWDPYYYSEYGSKIECAKTFVLHFNDGAPYKDWDNTNPTTIAGSSIADSDGDTGTAQEMLDDVAYQLRKRDCRTDIGEHQEIVSYYVYAALGEGEANNDSTRKMRESAANGGFVDKNDNHQPDPAHPADFISYYQTFLDGGTCTPNEWDDDGDCNPDTFYYANDGYALVAELNAAFESILRRASSGGAASVISASSSGEGAIYQAMFQTKMASGSYEVAWTGDVHGLLVDAAGRMREDDGDFTLEDPGSDNIVDMCYDTGEKNVRVKLSASEGARPTPAESAACSGSVFTSSLFDINYLWSGGEWLSNLTNAQTSAQRSYTSTTPGRYIFTAFDNNKDGIATSSDTIGFVPTSFSDSNAGLLNASDATEAQAIVKWVRGEDQTGLRARTIDGGKTWRLGDIIYSTPTTVSRPAESFDLLYNDASYLDFRKTYNSRRQVIYAGANDGMLHAFNGGWYDAKNHKFETAASGDINFELGSELWAYVPYNVLPHLKYLSNASYGSTTGNHLYFVDLKPRIFDAKIFAADATHPNGWGTVLVGGMRYGGGAITVDVDTTSPGADIRSMRSSYFILDITDPDQVPRLLMEFSHADMGFTSAIPAPFVHDGNWYLMLGSGPDNSISGIQNAVSTRNGKIFLINLNSMSLDASFGSSGIATLPDASSFLSDLISVDYELDYNADAIYFGTVSGSTGSWGGKLYRIQTQNADGTLIPVSAWTPSILYDTGLPITARPNFAIDDNRNRWVYVGSGRYLTRNDAADTSPQKFFGIKEPRDSSGAFTWTQALAPTMVDVSSAAVSLTGDLAGVTEATTFDELNEVMMNFASDYHDGWLRSLTPSGNRVIGEASVLGGSLTHTAYKPSATACEVDGTAQLSVTYYTTGTASYPPIIGVNDDGTTLRTTIDVGIAPALTPSIHVGSPPDDDGGDGDDTTNTKAFIQTSTGKIIAIDQKNAKSVKSGEQSWRQLQ